MPKFGDTIKLLDLRIHGKQYKSKNDTLFMLFNINLNDEKFKILAQELEVMGVAKIEGEPF